MQSHKAQGAEQIPSKIQGKHFKTRLVFHAWSKHNKQLELHSKSHQKPHLSFPAVQSLALFSQRESGTNTAGMY